MSTQIERLRQEIRMENRKFLMQLLQLLIGAVVIGVGIAIERFTLFHT
jgi:hypothetical protein